MEREGDEPRWTRASVVEIDGRPVTVYTSNVPPPGTPRRVYWFSAPPTTATEAEAISEHIEDLHDVLERSDPHGR